MKILSIETSCDETAISIVEAAGDIKSLTFTVLGNALFSQIESHKKYGGVYPMLAKRKHAQNFPLVLHSALLQASLYQEKEMNFSELDWKEVEVILQREEGLYESLKNILKNISKPDIDVIAVTSGPGLAPALWVGISCAKALRKLWKIPIVPINHMEGHIVSVLIENTDTRNIQFPALALLISGGHTELVDIQCFGKYKIIGQTRDDAVGEAFDKTARMLGLPYPGGPEISRLAKYARENNVPRVAKLPRPMLHSHDLNFSFSGLKTSVLYYIRDHFNVDIHSQVTIKRGLVSPESASYDERADLAREFEDAVVEVLFEKTKTALDQTGAKTLIIAGGVIANDTIRSTFTALETERPDLTVKIPMNALSTDNALMIACAAYINICLDQEILSTTQEITANGNLSLDKK